MEQHTPDLNAPPRRDVEPRPPLGDAAAEGEEARPFHVHEEFRPRQRRVALPLCLFAATCLSTFCAGTFGVFSLNVLFELVSLNFLAEPQPLFELIKTADWRGGFVYMAAVMLILLAHEMGHFLMTVRHRIPASLPFFIPVPIPLIGTMGAVIAMQGSRADRKQLFDIGLAGPLAGLLVCVPVLCLGIFLAQPGPSVVHQPLITRLLVPWIRPDLVGQDMSYKNPLLMAGWVGLFVTGLNMLPISQLDGGHVIYALFRRRAHYLAYTFFFATIVWIVATSGTQWILMLALVTLIGVEHPPTANDAAQLGPWRVGLGFVSLLVPILCFPPTPFDQRMLGAMGVVVVGVCIVAARLRAGRRPVGARA